MSTALKMVLIMAMEATIFLFIITEISFRHRIQKTCDKFFIEDLLDRLEKRENRESGSDKPEE